MNDPGWARQCATQPATNPYYTSFYKVLVNYYQKSFGAFYFWPLVIFFKKLAITGVIASETKKAAIC
jgi:hypothetical protein